MGQNNRLGTFSIFLLQFENLLALSARQWRVTRKHGKPLKLCHVCKYVKYPLVITVPRSFKYFRNFSIFNTF